MPIPMYDPATSLRAVAYNRVGGGNRLLLDVAVFSPPARSVPDACHWHAEPSEGISCGHGYLLPRYYAHIKPVFQMHEYI